MKKTAIFLLAFASITSATLVFAEMGGNNIGANICYKTDKCKTAPTENSTNDRNGCLSCCNKKYTTAAQNEECQTGCDSAYGIF